MSTTLTLGSMLYMTCLQMATESSSRPKSVMKAISLGWPEVACCAASSNDEPSSSTKRQDFRISKWFTSVGVLLREDYSRGRWNRIAVRMPPQRTIFHVDMDAFFVSVEEL